MAVDLSDPGNNYDITPNDKSGALKTGRHWAVTTTFAASRRPDHEIALGSEYMDTLEYTQFDKSHNHEIGRATSMVKQSLRTSLTRGQIDLLEMLPERDDVIMLDDAVAIVSRTGRQAYGQIVTLINRGAIAVEFLRYPTVDAEIILRRL